MKVQRAFIFRNKYLSTMLLRYLCNYRSSYTLKHPRRPVFSNTTIRTSNLSTTHMFMFHHQNEGQYCNIKLVTNSSKMRYKKSHVWECKNCINKEIKNKLNSSGNVYNHSVHTHCSVWMWNLIPCINTSMLNVTDL